MKLHPLLVYRVYMNAQGIQRIQGIQGIHGFTVTVLCLKAGFHRRRSRSRIRRRKSASDLVKIENRSRKRNHKLNGIGVGRIRTVPFSSDSAYVSDAYDPVKTRLSESQAESEEPTNHNAGFILWLPLTTPAI